MTVEEYLRGQCERRVEQLKRHMDGLIDSFDGEAKKARTVLRDIAANTGSSEPVATTDGSAPPPGLPAAAPPAPMCSALPAAPPPPPSVGCLQPGAPPEFGAALQPPSIT